MSNPQTPVPQPIEGEASRGKASKQESLPVHHNPGKARVLVIDDEPEIGRAVRTGLGGAKFSVEWAPTGEQGMDLLTRWHPDVIILDLSLPDLDGIEVCRRLRSWSQAPIIVLSVREGDADKVTALELGADDYLTKPFSIAELVARVRVALRHTTRTVGGGDFQARLQT